MHKLSSTPFSILDLAPLRDDNGPGPVLLRSLALAQHAERLGFSRFWVADVVVSGGSQ